VTLDFYNGGEMTAIPDGDTNTASTSGLTINVRAFGRFCLIPEGRLGEGTERYERVHVVGLRVDKNPALGFENHFMTLTVPLTCVKFFTRRPDLTTFSNHGPVGDVDELYVWNLAGCDVTLTGEVDGEVTVPSPNPREDIPNLVELVDSGDGTLAPEFHRDRQRSAADCVFTIETGVVRPLSPIRPRQIEFEPMDPAIPPSRRIARDLAEGIAIEVPAVGTTVTINIHRRTDNVRWSITIEKDVVTKADPIATLGNTCGCVVDSDVPLRDNEFAAYYELLKNPGPTRERLIPVLTGNLVSSGGCDVPSILRS
jgi:hypothetical protein